jgi:hypothetical protein
MNKLVALAIVFALLSNGGTAAIAAESDVKMACNDGTMDQVKGKDTCSKHGGVWKAKSGTSTRSAATPIDTTKGLTPPSKTAATTKIKTRTASGTTPKKAPSRGTRGPTAKCMDGALYYSRERRGACATHGGVDKWYGW